MIKSYLVEVRAQFPAAGERPGSISVYAQNKREACKKARKQLRIEGLVDRHTGPVICKAEELSE